MTSRASRGGAPAQERELRAQGRQTMRRLLDAAMVVFETRGYHAARVDDIVKVAKTSHGTFYLYFANKEDLFRALAADVGDQMMALAGSLGKVGPDAAGYDELRGWLGRFSEIYLRYGPVVRAWTEAEMSESDFGRMGTQLLAGFTRDIAARIAESAAAGVDPQIGALAFLAMIERFHYYLLSRQVPVEPDDALDTLARVIHAGVFGGSTG